MATVASAPFWPCHPLGKESKMKIRLHEIELNAKDTNASKIFYHDILGLPIVIDQQGLKVFDSGSSEIDPEWLKDMIK